MPDTLPRTTDPLAALIAAAGVDAVHTSDSDRAFYSQDLYAQGLPPLAVVRPASIAALCQTVAAATASGLAVFPRGGGMSYTHAFLPNTARSIVVDTSALDRILTIDADRMFVTVEAGCTWAALDAALQPYGLRPAFWGPMSGARATIGGAMSQGALSLGSARHGGSAGVALGFGIVAADGRILVTGSAGQPGHTPFYRTYGPDLTGLFTGDAGALGIKATVTLALIPRPTHVGGASFAFDGLEAMVAANTAIARLGLATEVIGMDKALMRIALGKQDLRDDAQAAMAVLRAAPDPITGLRRLMGMAASGKAFLTRADWTCHFATEADEASGLAAMLRRIRSIAGAHGQEIANSLPTVLRANPFPPPDVVGPGGKRLLAMHGIVPLPEVAALHRETMALLDRHATEMQAAGVELGLTTTTVGTNGFLYEPVLYWPDALTPFFDRTVPADRLATLPKHQDNPTGRTLVAALQQSIIDIIYRHGGVHVQIGRAYPYARDRDPGALALLRAIKAELDPKGLINPGALGL